MSKEIKISTEFIRLDAFLKLAGAVQTGGQAKAWIQDGRVTVNGEVCTQRGKKLIPDDTVGIDGDPAEFTVSSDCGRI